MDDYCVIGGEIITLPTNDRCDTCIRPCEKLRLCFYDLCWIACCKLQGCCCGEMCSNWTLSNGFCIFHNVVCGKFGFPEFFQEIWKIDKLEMENRVFISGYTFNKIVFFHKAREEKGEICIKSNVKNIVITYDKAVSVAIKLHFLIKEVFNQHLLPELYPSWVWQ